jgi:hypothetical protein
VRTPCQVTNPRTVLTVGRAAWQVYREGCGEQSAGVPLTEDTRFRIYSMTKAIATTALCAYSICAAGSNLPVAKSPPQGPLPLTHPEFPA